MSHTIRGFQEDKALLVSDAIAKKVGDQVSVERVHSLLVKRGIVSDMTYWRRIESVLADLGYDYDEVFEVIQ
ncbi:hypothetical protein SEA_TANDEM_84 [Microbacterium phage Tandem]|nr:hypothetical protein SEA_TANDEM_84 [Microbacterium phage Tandem]